MFYLVKTLEAACSFAILFCLFGDRRDCVGGAWRGAVWHSLFCLSITSFGCYLCPCGSAVSVSGNQVGMLLPTAKKYRKNMRILLLTPIWY